MDDATTWLEPLKERLAALPAGICAFDADYTLWADDIGFAAWDDVMQRQALKPEAIPALAEELMGIGAQPRFEPHADGAQLMELYKLGAVSGEALVTFMVTCFAGSTEAELLELGARLAERRLGPAMYAGAAELLSWLKGRGHRIAVVSASAEWLVRGAVEAIGLDVDVCVGARARLGADGRLTHLPDEPVCHGPHKPERLRRAGHDWQGEVVAAFSDSASDIPLLEAASGLRVAVSPSDELAKHAEAAGAPYLIVRPPVDVRGRPVQRYPDSFWV